MLDIPSGVVPAYPRLSFAEATARVRLISNLTLEAASECSTTSTEGARYYPSAPERVNTAHLIEIQEKVRELATAHGFPRTRGGHEMTAFDQTLAGLLFREMRILPADAADEEVWSFLTLNVCPDVAIWRYPNASGEDGTVREDYERLIGKPRNVFRRAWWRGFVLGLDLSALLLEDEAVAIMERPSIGGNPVLARLVAAAHLQVIDTANVGGRTMILRDAMKRLRRRMGQLSMHAMSPVDMGVIVDEVFEESLQVLVGKAGRRKQGTESSPAASETTTGSAVSTEPHESLEPIERFRVGIADYWHLLEEFVVEVPWDLMARYREELPTYLDGHEANRDTAKRIARDLETLIQSWDVFSAPERAVVHAAVHYFLQFDDGVPDYYLTGLDDDDAVVSAAFEALGVLRG